MISEPSSSAPHRFTSGGQPSTPSSTSRRSFFSRAIVGIAALIGGTLVWPIARYVSSPVFRRRDDKWMDVGSVSQLPTGVPYQLDYTSQSQDGWRKVTAQQAVWVVKQADNKITVFSPICPHLGCAFRWDAGSKHFKCPCHGSEFDVTGKVVGGPAPRPLDTLPSKTDHGDLSVMYKMFRSGLNHQEEL